MPEVWDHMSVAAMIHDTLLVFIAVGISMLFYTLAWSRKQSGLV